MLTLTIRILSLELLTLTATTDNPDDTDCDWSYGGTTSSTPLLGFTPEPMAEDPGS